MKKSTIAIIVVGLLVLWGIISYNGLIKMDNAVAKAWANVQNDYQSRLDLIPNLVATVKGAANFETETLTKVIEARASATQMKIDAKDLTPEKLQEFQASQGQLSSALGRLMVVVEKYPELKANENFLRLQEDLKGIDSRIRVSRKDYNDAIENFNNSSRRFPTVIFASLFNMKAKTPFAAAEGAEKTPSVDFSKP